MAKTVVILGGSYAGLHVAHALLKKNDKDVKVILVSKNSHFYWNVASVRAIVPGIIKDDEIFKPLASALQRYPSTSYELIIGTAESTDFDAKTVRVATAAGPRTLSYDQLVLATGANCPTTDVPWKASGTYEETLAGLHETADKVKGAERIVVAGAGSTGIEVAGELGFQYGKTKEITLLSSGPKLLGGDIVGPAAANELKKLKVNIRYDSQVQRTAPRGDGKIEIFLANGEVVLADLYLPTMGLVPNSEYINAKYLVEGKKTVEVDDFLRVKDTANVWAAGDVVSKPRAGFMITQKQAGAVAKNVELALKGQPPVVAKGFPFDILACSTGRSRGAGRAGSVKLPSFFVWMAKGRTLALQMVPSYIDGSVA
ncbi:hypothetical protein B0T22DRAFT_125089 [Podospora appendiculata]|uniref:FAD/NAD(P)-binding domain-containing protein n=1 Tax=Podospora appendiculata TaxID=314037 RepID=A0AAE1CBC7_9PEZI|nr:hypothetical protein B0T22DRAFT_125089 [Podospora appendiculata]